MPGESVDDYLEALRYRRYSRSVLLERRRLLGAAAAAGTDAWLMTAPIDEVVDAVRARTAIRSRTNLAKVRMVVENYRRWRREREAEP
ncbi:MAG: hypothetical protein ABFC89_04230 [Methanospirillum sp.]